MPTTKNSYNVIFSRHEVIKSARARVRVSPLRMKWTNREFSEIYREVDNFGSKLFEFCKKEKNPEKAFIDELDLLRSAQGTKEQKWALEFLKEGAIYLIYTKYQQLKEALGE